MSKKDLQMNFESGDSTFFKFPSNNSEEVTNNENHRIFPERLSKEYIKNLPIISFKGEIHIIERRKDMERAIKKLRKEVVLGFDTETRPSFKKGQKNQVSLLQLSTSNDAYLFRLNILGLPKELVSLLGDKDILKVGVAILDDIRALQKFSKFKPEGFVELSNIGNNLGIITCGLQNLAAIFFGVKISKKERLTNWEKPQFNEKQCLYAATDAWICLKMFGFLRVKNLLPEKIIWKMPDREKSKQVVFKKIKDNRVEE